MKQKLLIFIFILSAGLSLTAKTSLHKVEPMNWWVGMKNPNLQLMVYGENIASTQPEINYQGVELKKVNRVENPNYLFLDLHIDEATEPGTFTIVFKEGKKSRLNYAYELKPRNNKQNIHQGFDASDVIYLLMPDRFSNGNPDNDSTKDTREKADRSNPNGRHGGDLQGVINHLDYIADMGFTALWLNPFLENNQEAYSYHGYAISDFYKVDSRHGSNELFVELVDKAHEKGVKVIMDMIFNHWGIAHWMMKDLPEQDWIHQHESFFRSNFRGPVVSDPYASEYDTKQMLTGWFDVNMPDLNQKNPLLATYLIQNTLWWIEYAGLDGIRVDTQPYPYKEFMADWAKAVMAEYPTFNIVGEAWLQKILITSYFQGGAKNKDGYDSQMPAVTDFPMFNAINAAFNQNEGWTDGLAQLYYVLAQDFAYANPSNLVIFPDNHDLNRYFESLNKDFNKYKMGLAFLLTTRGIPQIYYGTEILMDGQEHQGHGFIRKDFPGGWAGDTINAFTGDGLGTQQKEAQDFVRNLLNWRKNNEVIHKGKLVHFLPNEGVYVMFRHTEDQAVMLVLNNNNEQAKELDANRYREILNQYKSGTEIISGTALSDLTKISIPAKSAMIIELSK
ncbi:MAG: glycoside hydrolase family 13 protein [Salinivirgaceae bacterium]